MDHGKNARSPYKVNGRNCFFTTFNDKLKKYHYGWKKQSKISPLLLMMKTQSESLSFASNLSKTSMRLKDSQTSQSLHPSVKPKLISISQSKAVKPRSFQDPGI